MMQWRRVYQPRNPLFWIMLALNALSLALSWIAQNRSLNVGASLMVGTFAIGNAVMGTWLLWRLLSTPPKSAEGKDTPPD